ncbi:hypothetical protein B4902_08990 [Yersinia frederiksenii]|uniref:Uncharacterized protein n=1 Tax=Yersinia massiliensis TaxID=419257 RepID=A0ABM6UV09_9GAMM|nr:hypothetical protein DA391_14640 [Yersinia massiliensis]OWF73393.1 hypothetical protein B4902_08990 [Yersinia frederiksenii]
MGGELHHSLSVLSVKAEQAAFEVRRNKKQEQRESPPVPTMVYFTYPSMGYLPLFTLVHADVMTRSIFGSCTFSVNIFARTSAGG